MSDWIKATQPGPMIFSRLPQGKIDARATPSVQLRAQADLDFVLLQGANQAAHRRAFYA